MNGSQDCCKPNEDLFKDPFLKVFVVLHELGEKCYVVTFHTDAKVGKFKWQPRLISNWYCMFFDRIESPWDNI